MPLSIHGSGLPTSVVVGTSTTIYLDEGPQAVARADLAYVGVTDGFGRVHKVPKKDIKTVKAQLDRYYPDEPYQGPDIISERFLRPADSALACFGSAADTSGRS